MSTAQAPEIPEKRYLKWYNKVGYGSGDVGGNVVYAFLSAFVMIYLTDTMGMNAGIIGTLMMVSKIFDGVSDFIFGTLLDRTRTKWGKARPWMFWGYFGCAATLVASFAVPASLSETGKYVWFFIAYTLLNAVFFTANNIAFSALTALITKNPAERVQMGSIRFMFAFGTSLLIQTITVGFVANMGGDANAWRLVAIIYAVIGLLVNSLSVFSVRELPDEELRDQEAGASAGAEEKVSVKESLGMLFSNRFYALILSVFLLTQIMSSTLNMGIYFMTYILLDAELLAVFAWAINIPQILGLLITPFLVARMRGMYKLNLGGYTVTILGRIGVLIAATMGSVPLMLLFTGIAALGMSPLQGTLNALIAEASEYTYLSKGKRIDGIMFSCTSLGTKIGGGVGTALAGWLLSASGYVGDADVQAESALNMLRVIYLWMPIGIAVIVVALLMFLNVERVNRKLRLEAGAAGTKDS